MSRAFCVPGVILIFCALVLSILVSISLPFLTGLDIARVQLTNGRIMGSSALSEIRFGNWAPCYYSTDVRTCLEASHAYNLTITDGGSSQTAFINSAWTRGLAVHPVAAIVTFIAFIFALSTHVVVTLIASLITFLAALLTLIAFAIDIALLVLVMNEVDKLEGGITTKPGPGFWLTFVSLILLLLGGCTVCCGRRRDRLSNTSNTNTTTRQTKPSFFRRFRRPKN